jgi:hypothetical protein
VSNSCAFASGGAQNASIRRQYSIGLLDVPHKIVLSPIFELPFGEGKRWATSGNAAAILGDWTISSIIAFERLPDCALDQLQQPWERLLQDAASERDGADPDGGNREDRLFYTGANPGLWLNSAGGPTGCISSGPNRARVVTSARRTVTTGISLPVRTSVWAARAADSPRSAEHHQHGEDTRRENGVGRGQLRASQRSARLHAAHAVDVPNELLGGLVGQVSLVGQVMGRGASDECAPFVFGLR